MNSNFGKRLRELRISKGFTQEEAAELLGVSKQSVSRWECEQTYPDILFLPTIAAFYNVSTDSIFGLDAEKIAEEKQKILNDIKAAANSGDTLSAFYLSQKMYTKYPNDLAIIDRYMREAYVMGIKNVNGGKRHYLQLSIAAAERIESYTDDLNLRCASIRNIATCHRLLGNCDMAQAALKRLPSLVNCQETAMISILQEEDLQSSVNEGIISSIDLIIRLLYANAQNENADLSEKRKNLSKIIGLLKVVFDDGNYLRFDCVFRKVSSEITEIEKKTSI